METMRAIARRKSVHAYKPEQLSEESLNSILTAGCAAPMGMAAYDRLHLTVVQDKTLFAKLSEAMIQVLKKAMNVDRKGDFTFGAPTVIIISAKEPEQTPMPGMHYINAGCVAENMMLAASDMGIGSLVAGTVGFAVESDVELKKALGIPDDFTALFGITLGFDAKDEQTEKSMKMTINMNRV